MGRTAIVVDPLPLVRAGLGAVLRGAGVYVVGEAEHPEGGAAQAKALGADFLVVGGHDLASVGSGARLLGSGGPTRVVVLVGRATREEMADLVADGVAGFLPRAVTPADLAASLDRVGRGERVICPSLVPMIAGADAPAVEADAPLTAKERGVLASLAAGRSNKEIAAAHYISPATVRTHLAHIYGKLGVAGRQQATRRAFELGLVHC